MARSGYTDLFDDFFGNGSGAGKTAEKAGAKASVDEVSRQVREMQDFLQKKTAELTREMANDGLLDPAAQPQQTAAAVQNAEQGSWEGISEKLAAQLVGQEELLQSLVRAFRRPTLLPPQGENARNVIYLYGGNGSGRHSALRMVAAELAARGLLQSPHQTPMQVFPAFACQKIPDIFPWGSTGLRCPLPMPCRFPPECLSAKDSGCSKVLHPFAPAPKALPGNWAHIRPTRQRQ